MKVRHASAGGYERVQLDMTPMIDVVFQLLAFFIMTLKIVQPEGDFNIKMPLSAAGPGAQPPKDLPPIQVYLDAAPDGRISSIRMGDRSLASFQALRDELLSLVGPDRGPGSTREEAEVVLNADFNLKYRYAMDAITAITGYVDSSGNTVKLIEKIKFAQPKEPDGGG